MPKTQREPNKFVKGYFIFFVIFIAFIVGLYIGQGSHNVNSANNQDNFKNGTVSNLKTRPEFLSKDVDFELFWDTWNLVKKDYLRQPVNDVELLYGAMAGIAASLNDPYSEFFDPETTVEFHQGLEGAFEGIGAEIGIKNEQLTIVSPLPDSPAMQAGLKSGDKVVAIDGENTAGISIEYAVNKIRGPHDTEVVLTVERSGEEELIDITIVRKAIDVKSLTWEITDDNIAILKLRSFNSKAVPELDAAIVEIVKKNPKGVILDLRHNSGGYLEAALIVASEWIEDGPILYERLSSGEEQALEALNRARLNGFSTVVLINEGSASASEIVAGALQDYAKATLVGKKSFGKGVVQSVYPLPDGSSLKLTVAEWLTPNKNAIDGQGIEPDIEVELTDEDYDNNLDPQLDKAIEVLNQED